MKILEATWVNGQVQLNGHPEWPEGLRLLVREAIRQEMEFLTEEEQSDDPQAIQQWIDELRSIPPVPEIPDPDGEREAWEETMRRFNIEAVRRQFEQETP